MEDHEFEAIVRAMQAEIDRQLDNPEDVELICRELDDERILGILRPSNGGRERKTFVVSGRDEDGEVIHEWAEDLATESFFTYIMLYGSWTNPTHGAVSPALSEFFGFCHRETPALVNWARWLRINHEMDDGGYTVEPEMAEILVEAAIALKVEDDRLADQMRRAVGGEPLGECDPNQLSLFS
jgi:hypothetical protein